MALAKNRNRKREVVLIDDLNVLVGSKEIYTSYLRYPIDYYEYYEKKHGSVAGYEGSCYSDILPIDLDSENLNDALNECRILIGLLETEYEVIPDCLGVFFSGSKGFHIEIPTILFGDIQPSPELPYIFKEIPKILDVKYHDTKIYNRNQIWRATNTINSKSGLYKYQLSYRELNTLTIDDIVSNATEANTAIVPINYEDWAMSPQLAEIWAQARETNSSCRKPEKGYIFSDNGANGAIYHEGVAEGNRNNRAFEIARELKAKGRKINETKEYIIKEWNPRNHPPESNIQSLYRTVESVYNSSIQDSGSVYVLKHLRNDPYYNSLSPVHRAIYIDIICHLNEVSKVAWQKFTCNVNQLIYSCDTIAHRVGVKNNQVRTVIKKLKGWGRITVEVLNNNNKVACSRLTFLSFESQAKPQANSPHETENNRRLNNNYYHNKEEERKKYII